MHALLRWPVVVAAVVMVVGCRAAGVPPAGGVETQSVRAPAPADAPASLSRAEQETFLAKARIVRTRNVSLGVTGTLRATLTDGRVTHDASIQTVDEFRPLFQGRRAMELNFRDAWRYNVAAYRLDRLLDLGMIPPSVERSYQGMQGAFTWWVDDVLMDEGARLKKKMPTPDARRWNEQMWHVRLFDQLIDNTDRNLGNLLIDTDWRIWMIDHTRAFRLGERPRAPGDIVRCDRAVFERLVALDLPGVTAAMERYLLAPEIKALLLRRDAIVEHLEKTNALFEWQRPAR
jgi:hypothetical protein